MRKILFVVLFAALAASVLVVPQTVNMGRTYTGTLNVQYANEGVTGTTVNKLAKLTGAPSTAIIAATTDTAGIVGVVVAGAGTTGNAIIAFKGKALCDFDSATTAGHYVTIDTSTAGDCMDTGAATYPTSGQVIGVVTTTNGGAGTYEVDLTLGQPQAGGAGGGVTTSTGTYAALPGTCTAGDLYLPTNSFYNILRCTAGNVWVHFWNGKQATPPVLGDFAWVNQGGATATTTNGGIYLLAPATAGHSLRILKKAAPATPYTITAVVQQLMDANSIVGIGFRESSTGKITTCDGGSSSHNVLIARKWTDATTFSANYVGELSLNNRNAYFAPPVIIIRDTGVNRTCEASYDGINSIVVNTIGRTDFITADEVLFFANTNGNTLDAGINVISWVQGP